MAYATEQDLIDRFGAEELAQLSDRINGVAIDSVVVGLALADADAEIDSYLATRYALPLASVPADLARIAADIARYRLYDDRPTETVRKRYEDGVRDLKALAKGDKTLSGGVTLTPADDSIAVTSRSPERVFNADFLADY